MNIPAEKQSKYASEKNFFIVINGRPLKAEKKKTRYGGEWWGLTVIDYKTEEGIYTIVKETGELWTPLTTPWYTAPLEWDVGFKTTQTLKELLSKIRENLPQLKQADLSKITGISIKILSKLERGKKETATLSQLLTLISLKSTLTQTDMKNEILKIEKEIDKIEGNELPEQRENVLYINLKTSNGASLIGHTLADGELELRGEKRRSFRYINTELINAENVSKIIKNYGAKAAINTAKGRGVDGKKYKDQYIVSVAGILGYALYRAIPKAAGLKTKNNPKAPSEIIEDPKLAFYLAQAMIKDEAHVDPKNKDMTVEMYVGATKKLKNRKQEIQTIAEEQVREKEEKKGEKLTRMEELAARHVNVDEVSEETVKLAETVPCNTLLSLKEALETLGIKTIEEGIQNFYASEKKNITACWKIYLDQDETKKAYEFGLITGPKKKDYEARFKKITNCIRLMDSKKNNWKLSKEHIDKLEKLEYRQKEGKEVVVIYYSKIMNNTEFREIVEVIKKNTSQKLEKKKIELEKRGIKTSLEPVCIFIGEKVISVEWALEWFEN